MVGAFSGGVFFGFLAIVWNRVEVRKWQRIARNAVLEAKED